jgi:hypothetical protein
LLQRRLLIPHCQLSCPLQQLHQLLLRLLLLRLHCRQQILSPPLLHRLLRLLLPR